MPEVPHGRKTQRPFPLPGVRTLRRGIPSGEQAIERMTDAVEETAKP